jgi:multiple sugar transport system ATP-binding protein
MNVFENIAFPLKVAGMKREKIKESVEMAASMLKIEELLSAKPSELSGGQAQRVAIARALVRRPNIFLMDEPLSNLDAPLRASTRGEIKQLQRSMGVTTVYVTHDQAEAMSLGDRVAVLNEGKVQQVGKPKELYENPANPFVARFIGTVPMNLLKATLSGEGEQLFINVEKQKMKMPQRMREKVKKMRGRTLILGIRAEDIRIEDEGMRVKVLCVEELGKARLVRARLGKQNLSILFEGERVNEGESVNVKFCLDKACIFEEEC